MPKQTSLFGARKGAKKAKETGPVKVGGYHVPRKTITRSGYDVPAHERKRPKGRK